MYTLRSTIGSHSFVKHELPMLVSREMQACREIVASAQKILEECCNQEADPTDQASNEEMCAEARRQKRRAEKFLQELQGREGELKRGTFHGDCRDCGAEIGEERLRAQLVTHHCVACKERKEIRGNRYAAVV